MMEVEVMSLNMHGFKSSSKRESMLSLRINFERR